MKDSTTENNKPETSTAEATDGAAAANSENGDQASPSTAAEAAASTGESSPNQELYAQLDAATAEAAEMKDRYIRSVAELDNFRRRIAREKQEIIKTAAAGLIEDLLPVLDNLQLGLSSGDKHPEAAGVTKGFAMVFDQLRNVLREQGLEELSPADADFDPNLHDAITQQPSDEIAEGRVIQTIRTGYRLNEHLIRAASVIVSSGPSTETDNS